jgi:hypothetical protein
MDTGALVALPDRSERNHLRCVDFFKLFEGEIFTTEPVLTETIYLLGPSIRAQKRALDFFIQGGAILVPQSGQSLLRAAVLMEKYKDTPMDFADATLVCLAEETGIKDIFTLDIRGFSAYRFREKMGFVLFPEA